jgi:5-formyltetrahydrofolate cyclo-ligase
MLSDKAAARREMKRRLSLVPKDRFREEGRKAAAVLRQSPLWRGSPSVLVFLSMEDEVDTGPFIEAALEDGKKVFVPRVETGRAGTKRMRFYRICSAEGLWEKGTFGIREPAGGGMTERFAGAEFRWDCPALVLTPGVAFDREGCRLGRGGGFYDRFFAELDEAGAEYTALGLCLPCQIEDALPVDAWDKKVHAVWQGHYAPLESHK